MVGTNSLIKYHYKDRGQNYFNVGTKTKSRTCVGIEKWF